MLEDSRAAWGWTWTERLWQDLRYGCRTIARHPGLALVAVISLAVGIGANCAIFSLAEGLLLRPLPEKPLSIARIYDRDLLAAAACRGLHRTRFTAWNAPGASRALMSAF